ncbi:hypothetical protein HNQ56_000280 [Anaerotaenia torta]|uniref:spore coat associated protein CotJA n=1 Tax=Anaerotaenia torta TaxID=433293 RepID=UPI003D1AB4B1
MDRRMYRGTAGNCNNNYNRNAAPYRPAPVYAAPVCGDTVGGAVSDNRCEKSCFDGNTERFPIGMCYVPWQCFRDIYENECTALANGTMFKELDLNWYGRGCR